jgi:hypothetical protein
VRTLAVVVGIAALVALPAASAKGPQPVLGIDWNSTPDTRLAWYDPSSLAKMPGRKAPLAGHTWPWAFSSDRSRLAIAGQEDAKQLRFVNARTMRVLGQVPLRYAGDVSFVTWVRPDRVLAYVQGYFDGKVVVVDAVQRRIERTIALSDRVAYGGGSFVGGLALLLGTYEGFSPAAVGVIDADGAVRSVTLGRISVGTSQPGTDSRFETRRPGFAVDPAGRRAFVVDADFTVAEVDLETLAVTYHTPSTRSLAKAVSGPLRVANWLGNGVLAVSGVDYNGEERGSAVGLRFIDANTWTRRLVDPRIASFDVGAGILVGTGPRQEGPHHYDVYGFDGRFRYGLDVERLQLLRVQGAYAYLCTPTGGALRVLDAPTGASLSVVQRPGCPTLLYGQSSS